MDRVNTARGSLVRKDTLYVCANQKEGKGKNAKRERTISSGARLMSLMRASGGLRCSDENQRVPGDAWLKKRRKSDKVRARLWEVRGTTYHRHVAQTRQYLPHQNHKRHRLW